MHVLAYANQSVVTKRLSLSTYGRAADFVGRVVDELPILVGHPFVLEAQQHVRLDLTRHLRPVGERSARKRAALHDAIDCCLLFAPQLIRFASAGPDRFGCGHSGRQARAARMPPALDDSTAAGQGGRSFAPNLTLINPQLSRCNYRVWLGNFSAVTIIDLKSAFILTSSDNLLN